MDEIGGMRIADAPLSPAPGPYPIEFTVGPARNKNIPHEFTGILRRKYGPGAIYRIPVIAVGAQRIIHAAFCRLFEIRKEKVIFGVDGNRRDPKSSGYAVSRQASRQNPHKKNGT